MKRIAVSTSGISHRGEAVVTKAGLEGGAIYAMSGSLREQIDRLGAAELRIDLRPDLPQAVLEDRLATSLRGRSHANVLRQRLGLSPVAIGLVQEVMHRNAPAESLAALIKGVPLCVTGMQPIERAISSAGGIMFEEWDESLMLKRLPGVFVAGEMLDWDAPTGGYLLQAAFATGVKAAHGALAHLGK